MDYLLKMEVSVKARLAFTVNRKSFLNKCRRRHKDRTWDACIYTGMYMDMPENYAETILYKMVLAAPP